MTINPLPPIDAARQNPGENRAIALLNLGSVKLQRIGPGAIQSVQGGASGVIARRLNLISGASIEILQSPVRIGERRDLPPQLIFEHDFGLPELAPDFRSLHTPQGAVLHPVRLNLYSAAGQVSEIGPAQETWGSDS